MAPGIFHPDNKTFGYVPTTTTVTDTTAGYVWTYPDYQPRGRTTQDDERFQRAEHERMLKAIDSLTKQQQPKREEKKMRTLYRVIVVDPKSEKIVHDETLVAESAENAKLKADLPAFVRKSLDDYDIIAQPLGQIRPKRDVQRVKVVSEE